MVCAVAVFLFFFYFFIRNYLLENCRVKSCCAKQGGKRTPRKNENGRGGKTRTLSYTRKKRRSFFLTDNREIQKELEKLSKDIQTVKHDIKQFHDPAFRHKFSMSFLLDLEDFMQILCIVCSRIPAKKPLILLQVVKNVLMNDMVVYKRGSRIVHKCYCERGLTKWFQESTSANTKSKRKHVVK